MLPPKNQPLTALVYTPNPAKLPENLFSVRSGVGVADASRLTHPLALRGTAGASGGQGGVGTGNKERGSHRGAAVTVRGPFGSAGLDGPAVVSIKSRFKVFLGNGRQFLPVGRLLATGTKIGKRNIV